MSEKLRLILGSPASGYASPRAWSDAFLLTSVAHCHLLHLTPPSLNTFTVLANLWYRPKSNSSLLVPAEHGIRFSVMLHTFCWQQCLAPAMRLP